MGNNDSAALQMQRSWLIFEWKEMGNNDSAALQMQRSWAVGFKSLVGGKMVEDLRANGYVVISF